MESVFQQHFNTNFAPSFEETTQIKGLLQASAEELQRIDLEINRLQQQRSKVHELAEKYRALLSPVRRIDRDILEQIFLACLPVDRNPCMSATEAPVLLTQVCGSWRSIAHSTPGLWAAIHIPFHWDYAAPSREPRIDSEHAAIIRNVVTQREAAAKMWLDRSGNLPLSISIFQRLKYHDIRFFPDDPTFAAEFHEHYGTFIRSIKSYCERWRTLDVHLPNTALELLLEGGSIFERLKMLMSLHITAYDYRDRNGRIRRSEPEMLWLWPAVSSFVSSRISSATIFGVYPTVIGKVHPWKHLTELNFEVDVYYVESDAAIFSHTGRIISHCIALKTLKLTIIPRVDASSDSNNPQARLLEPIVLDHLEELSVSLTPSEEAVRFVQRLSLPAIRQLDFMFSGVLE